MSFAAGESKRVRVEYYDRTGPAEISLKVYGGPTGTMEVPGTWLSTQPPVLGPGWTMSTGGSAGLSITGAAGDRRRRHLDPCGRVDQ